jgi:WD40 repeat protein
MESKISASPIPKDEGIEELIQLLDREVFAVDSNQLAYLVADILVGDVSKEDYFKLVYLSVKSEKFSRVAANAITILNYAKVSFSGMDLSHVRIQYADLSQGAFDYANFTLADLTNCKIGGASFRFARFERTVIEGIRSEEIYKINYAHGISGFSFDLKSNFIAVAILGKSPVIVVHDLFEDVATKMFFIDNSDGTLRTEEVTCKDIAMKNFAPKDKVVKNKLYGFNSVDKEMILGDFSDIFLDYSHNFLLVALSYSGALLKFEIRSGDCNCIYRGKVSCIVEIKEQNVIAINDANNLLFLHFNKDFSEFKPDKFPTVHKEDITKIAYNSNALLLATISEDRHVLIWDLNKKSVVKHLYIEEQGRGLLKPKDVCFNPEGTKVAITFGDVIGIWETQNFKCLAIYDNEINNVARIRWGTGISDLIFSDWYGNLYQLDFENKVRILIESVGEAISHFEKLQLPGKNLLLVSSYDRQIRIIDSNLLNKKQMEFPISLINQLAIGHNSFFFSDLSGNVYEKEFKKGVQLRTFKSVSSGIARLIFTKEGIIVGCYFTEKGLVVFDLVNKKEADFLEFDPVKEEDRCGEAISLYPLQVAIGFHTGEMLYINKSTTKKINYHSQHAHSLCFSADGKYLVSGSGDLDGFVVIHDLKNYTVYDKFKISGQVAPKCCKFSTNSKFVCAVTRGETYSKRKIYLYDLQKKELKFYYNLDKGAESLLLSDEIPPRVVVGFTEKILIWDSGTNDCVDFRGHTSQIYYLAFLKPDLLLAIDRTNAYKLWKIVTTLDGDLKILLKWGYRQNLNLEGVPEEKKLVSAGLKSLQNSLTFFKLIPEDKEKSEESPRPFLPGYLNPPKK